MSVAETDAEGNLLASHKTPRDFTIRNLLTHSSGLGTGPQFAKNCPKPGYTEGSTLKNKIPDWAESYLYFDPGTGFAYSPRVAFEVLAHLVELTSDMDFDCFLRHRIFRPLGMTDTCFSPNEEQWSRMVRVYATLPDGSLRREYNLDRVVFRGGSPTYYSGGGGLATTLSDYVRFAGMLENFGELDGVRILSKRTVWGMQTPQLMPLMPKSEDYSWGLGMRVVLKDNGSQAPLRRGAFGWSGAYGTHFWCDPVHDLFAVYLSNMTTSGGSKAKTARHMEAAVMAHVPE